MSGSESALRRRLWFVLKLVVSVGLLIVLFRQTDIAAVGTRVGRADVRWLAAGLGLYGAMVLVSAWRWQLLLETQTGRPPLSLLSRSYLVATFFNNFLPSNIGGDVVRIADTVPLLGSKTVATTIVLLDRAIGLVALVLIAAVGSLVAGSLGLDLPGHEYAWMALASAVLIAMPTLVSPQLLPRLLQPLRRLRSAWVDERLSRVADLVENLSRDRLALGLTLAGAFGVQFILVLFFMAVAAALGTPLPLPFALVMVPTSFVVQMAPVSINGFGVREAVFAFFFAKLGLGVDAALAVSLSSAALILLFSLIGGVLFLVGRQPKESPSTVR